MLRAPALEGFDRVRHEAALLKEFLGTGASATLESAHFAQLLGRPYHVSAVGSGDVTDGERRLLQRFLEAREAVLTAALAQENTITPAWRAPRGSNPLHAFWDPSRRRPAAASGAAAQALSHLVRWSCDRPTFREPDFTDGLAGAFHAVCRRTTASLGSGEPLDEALRPMLHPRLFENLDAFTSRGLPGCGEGSGGEGGGFFHHEAELVGLPFVSHLTVVLGAHKANEPPLLGARGQSLEALRAPAGPACLSTAAVRDGGFVTLVDSRSPCAVTGGGGACLEAFASKVHSLAAKAHSEGVGPRAATVAAASALAGGLRAVQSALGAVAAAQEAVAKRGAMVYCFVNYDTREFLAARAHSGRRSRWATGSFEPWAAATRQWVFESPLLLPKHNGDGEAVYVAAEPDWRLVDVDGALGGNFFGAHLLEPATSGGQEEAEAEAVGGHGAALKSAARQQR